MSGRENSVKITPTYASVTKNWKTACTKSGPSESNPVGTSLLIASPSSCEKKRKKGKCDIGGCRRTHVLFHQVTRRCSRRAAGVFCECKPDPNLWILHLALTLTPTSITRVEKALAWHVSPKNLWQLWSALRTSGYRCQP